MAKGGAGSAKGATVGRPKNITVSRQNVTGVKGTAGKMSKVGSPFKAEIGRIAKAAAKGVKKGAK